MAIQTMRKSNRRHSKTGLVHYSKWVVQGPTREVLPSNLLSCYCTSWEVHPGCKHLPKCDLAKGCINYIYLTYVYKISEQ